MPLLAKTEKIICNYWNYNEEDFKTKISLKL